MTKVNSREHRVTRRAPAVMLADEQRRLHRLPDAAFTAAFGGSTQSVMVNNDQFPVVYLFSPHTLVEEPVLEFVSMVTRSFAFTSQRRARSKLRGIAGRRQGPR
ncbi:MAG: hypothetical protein R2706_11400 [Acidimicrobiales bacterium]